MLGILSTIGGFISKPLQKYQEERILVKQAKFKTQAVAQEQKGKVIEARTQRLANEQDNAHVWEKNVLIKSGVYLRWVCVLHIFAGMDYTIYAVFNGTDATLLWAALDLMPEWYSGLLLTVFGFCFGSAPLKSAGAKLAETWRMRKVLKAGIPDLDTHASAADDSELPALNLKDNERV